MGLKKLKITGLLLATSLFCFAQSGQTTVDSILSGGIYRTYRLYVPPSYSASTPVPLILNLHGYTSNAIQQQLYSNFMPIADTANFLVVYPNGTTLQGQPFWNSGITTSPDDVQFINQLIDYLRSNFSIDIRRVYSCGMSNGGIMSYYLACNLSYRIAAIASVSGTMLNGWELSCAPPRPFPVMEIHGTGDAIVPFSGDTNFVAVDSIIRKWVRHNNCVLTPQVDSVPNTNTSDGCLAVNYKYLNGSSGSSVELYKIIGGSHSWPGSIPIFPNTDEDFNASAEIWRFFRQYRLDAFISDVGFPVNKPYPDLRIFPNPSSEFLYVEGAEGCRFSIFAADGRWLGEENSSKQVNISALEPGLYFLRVRDNKGAVVLRFIKN